MLIFYIYFLWHHHTKLINEILATCVFWCIRLTHPPKISPQNAQYTDAIIQQDAVTDAFLQRSWKCTFFFFYKENQNIRPFWHWRYVQVMWYGHSLQSCYLAYSHTDRKKLIFFMRLWCHLDGHQSLAIIGILFVFKTKQKIYSLDN